MGFFDVFRGKKYEWHEEGDTIVYEPKKKEFGEGDGRYIVSLLESIADHSADYLLKHADKPVVKKKKKPAKELDEYITTKKKKPADEKAEKKRKLKFAIRASSEDAYDTLEKGLEELREKNYRNLGKKNGALICGGAGTGAGVAIAGSGDPILVAGGLAIHLCTVIGGILFSRRHRNKGVSREAALHSLDVVYEKD